MNFQIFTTVILFSIFTLSSCNKDDDITTLEIVEYATTLNQLDPLDKGGRWLANGIKETNELSSLEEEQEATITNYLNDLALNPETRCDDSTNDSFINDLISQSYPEEAIDIVENAIVRVCSELNYHEGYWTTEVNNPSIPFPIQVINDMHIDAATKRITVYAQQRVNGMVIVPAQVGPGDCSTTLMGDTACYHPNAVYLNGSGEEFLQADGTGAWWVKHSWVLGGEGYQNWELTLEEDYGEGLWVEGVLLGDDITMKVGDLDGSDGGFYNLRRPLLQNDPVTYSVERYLPPATTPDFSLEWECTTATSDFDGLARSCPKL